MSPLTRSMIISVLVKSNLVKLRNFNFRSLNCDISQIIGCKELNLTCIPALLTSRKKCDVDLHGRRSRSQGKKTLALQMVSQTSGQKDPTELILICAPK